MKRKLPLNLACHKSNSLSAVLEREYQNVPRETICEALWGKLKLVPAYQKQVFVNRNELWHMFMMTGTSLKRIIAVLKETAKRVYFGNPEEYEPDGEYYYTEEAGLVWSYGKKGCLTLGIKDRRRLERFLKAGQGMKYSVFPNNQQEYGKLVFDFTLDEVRKGNKRMRTLGEKSAKLVKLLLENRNRRFSFEELAEVLGEQTLYQDYRSKYTYCRSLEKIFERLNRDCQEKIFYYQDRSVVVLEPCRNNVADV